MELPLSGLVLNDLNQHSADYVLGRVLVSEMPNLYFELVCVGNHSLGIGDGWGFLTTIRLRTTRHTNQPGNPKKIAIGTSTITAWMTNRTIEAAVSTASPNERFMGE